LSYTPSVGHLRLAFYTKDQAKTEVLCAVCKKSKRIILFYSTIEATTPAPTVRPPSRIAKRRPSSIAIGAISSTSMEILSPGITISVPSGKVTTPVTSVVRK